MSAEVVMRSPNEMMQAAKNQMIEGREPSTAEDWVKVMNFIAFNIHPDAAESATKLVAMIYDCPLPLEMVEEIAAFQVASKQKEAANGEG